MAALPPVLSSPIPPPAGQGPQIRFFRRTLLLPLGELAKAAQIRPAWQDVLDRARRVPDVEFAALSDIISMRKGENSLSYRTAPAPVPASQELIALASTVTPDYLNVMGIPLREERFFKCAIKCPFSQLPVPMLRFFSSVMSIAVRTKTPPLNAVRPLQRELRGAARIRRYMSPGPWSSL